MTVPRWTEALITWVGKGALCSLATLLLGCPGGDKQGDRSYGNGPHRPEWMLDTTYTVVQIRDKLACSSIFCEQRFAELRRVCDEVVPDDGWLWAATGNGEQCRCACPQFSGLTPIQLDSVRSAQQLKEAKLLLKRKHQWDERMKANGWRLKAPPKPLKYPKDQLVGHVPVLNNDCAHVEMREMKIVPCWGLGWADKSSMALWAMGLFAQPENYPIFNYRIDSTGELDYPSNNGSWEHLGSWSVGDGAVTTTGSPYEIVFPIDFIEAPEVRWELMLFFVGHELGHALGSGTACGFGEIVCEGQCDHWGASVGLRRICGSGLHCRTYAEIALTAADQLEAYMARIHAEPGCGGPMCPVCGYDNAACGYPPMACRSETIRAASALLTEPDCTRSWYAAPGRPTSCPGPRLPGDDPCPSPGPA